MQPEQTNGRPLRVIELRAIDFKRLHAVAIAPSDKCVVVVKGPNEAGKTSAIDAMIAALGGNRRAPDQPVRTGAASASVTVTIGDPEPRYSVTRTFKDGRTYLSVKALTPDGEAKLSGAQGFLDGLVADISFNPLAFANAASKDQMRMLLAAIGAAERHELAQGRRAAIYDQRTEVNRAAASLKAELAARPDPAPDRQLAQVPDAEFAKRLNDANAHNLKRQQLRGQIEQGQQQLAGIDDEIKTLHDRIRAAESRRTQLQNSIAGTRQLLDSTPPDVDTSQITAALTRNYQANDAARRQAAARTRATQLREVEARADTLTAQLADIDGGLCKLVEESDIGRTVPGLAVTAAGEIMHNGVPFSQASGMRRLEISCLIGMAANPKLRVLVIDEGDRLDPAALKHLEEIATKYDFQIWMTAVYAGEADEHTHVCELADGRQVGAATPVEGEGASNTVQAASQSPHLGFAAVIPTPADIAEARRLETGVGFDL